MLWFEEALQDHDIVQVWMNGPFDWKVLVEECALIFGEDRAYALLDLVFRTIRAGRLSDIETREKLILNERGLLRDAEDEDGHGIPLYAIVSSRLGIDIKGDKKNPDAWRLRYGELRDVPFELWPDEAVRYAQDDAVYNLLCWESQVKDIVDTGYQDKSFRWLVGDELRKVNKKFAMSLMGSWGVRTDPVMVPIFSEAVRKGVERVERIQLAEGFARTETVKGVPVVTENRREVQNRVTLAYLAEALKEDAAELRRGSPSTEEALRKLGADGRADIRGLPAVWPKSVNPEGGGLAAFVDGVCTTPTTDQSNRFPQGQVSYSRLTKLQAADEGLVLMGQLGELQKLHSTYVPILSQGLQYPINPYWNEMVATGRSSCRGPNLQSLPTFGIYYVDDGVGAWLMDDEKGWGADKELAGCWTGRRAQALLDRLPPDLKSRARVVPLGGLRTCFVAREGWALLDADIDYAECVAWAQWCRDTFGVSDMGDVINAGEDPHIHLALEFPQLAGWSYAEAFAERKTSLLIKKMRQYAKSPGNFGRMGGMGAATLKRAAIGYEVFLSLEEAQLICDAFDRRWREAKLSDAWVNAKLGRGGDGVFTFVQPRSLRRRGGCNYTKGRNQAFQGGTADLADDVLSCLAVECYIGRYYDGRPGTSPLHGSRLWAFAHDEFILEVPVDTWSRDRTHVAACRLEQVIVERGRYWFPDIATRTEAALARRWVKDRRAGTEFKRVLDVGGRVIPMEDAK